MSEPERIGESIRVLIADDQRLMRDGLRALLELQAGITITGEAANGVEALAQSAILKPDGNYSGSAPCGRLWAWM